MRIPAATAMIAAGLLAFSIGTARAKVTIIGVALSPAHFPYFSRSDFKTFFDEAAQIGSHVTWIFQWGSMPPASSFAAMQRPAKQRGLKFQLWLSPTTLTEDRRQPDLPKSLAGRHFDDPEVRRAYTDEILKLASLRPDVLGLATEVNFLAQNPRDFEAFVSLAHETYVAVKKGYPAQIVTISFQWDVMRAHRQFDLLKRFGDSVDVFSFTSYPDAFGDPARVNLPEDYYSSIRKYLPSERIAISELGWSSAPPSSEDQQAAFFARVPEFARGAKFEFITLALMHDVSMFNGDLARLNYVGIRTIDDQHKKSWDVLKDLAELQ